MEAWRIGDGCHFDTLVSTSVPHILEKIFCSLDYESFKKCYSLNTAWNGLLSSDSFQKLRKNVFREDIERELGLALRQHYTQKIIKLVSRGLVDVNYKHKHLGHLLFVAAMRGNIDLVQFLMEKGADINRQDEYGFTVNIHNC